MRLLTHAFLAIVVVGTAAGLARADQIDDAPTGAPPVRREQPAAAPPPPPATPAPRPALAPAATADAAAAPAPAPDAGWSFMIAPYLWLPATKGTSVVDGVSSDIDASFSDIFENFDVFALNLRSEAKRDRLGFFFDFMWMDLDGDFGNSGILSVKPDIEQIKVDFGVMYTVLDRPAGEGRIKLTPYVGGRFSWLKQIIRFDSPAAAIPNAGDRQNWWEPMVGGRLTWQLNDPLAIVVQGDAGGFGIGNASDLTWQVGGMFSYKFTDWFRLNLGYWVLDIDYSRGSGRNEFGYDVRMQGPRIGLAFEL
jgi:hypothetical protein